MPKPSRPYRPLDAHHRFLLAIGVAAIALVVALLATTAATAVVLTWDAFALAELALAWIQITRSDARQSIRAARLQDSSRSAIFLFILFAAVASVCAVAVLLGSAKALQGRALAGHALLGGGTVLLSWCLIHTLFALHYAHQFYRAGESASEPLKGDGLIFPEEPHPDFLDFAYFSFVLGMCCQVSDVQISSRSIRRLALLHGALSFGFNAVILALAINLGSSLF